MRSRMHPNFVKMPSCPTPSPLLISLSSNKENQENQGGYVNSHRPASSSRKPLPLTTQPTKKFRKEQSELWDQRFQELVSFKQEHGHCKVPRTWSANPQLGTWLNTQRKQYRLAQQGESSQMIPDRKQKLEQLGFRWSLCEKQDWDVRFQELAEYRQIHGDCLVPQRYKLNPQLGIWVNNQRTQYRTFKDDGMGPMTADRANKLNDLGFIWYVSKRQNCRGKANDDPTKSIPVPLTHDVAEPFVKLKSVRHHQPSHDNSLSSADSTEFEHVWSPAESSADLAAAQVLIGLH